MSSEFPELNFIRPLEPPVATPDVSRKRPDPIAFDLLETTFIPPPVLYSPCPDTKRIDPPVDKELLPLYIPTEPAFKTDGPISNIISLDLLERPLNPVLILTAPP